MTAFRILSAAAVLALGALMLDAGTPGTLAWWATAVPFALWVAGPAMAPYLLAARQSRRWLAIVLLAYLGVSSVVSGLAYYDAFFRSRSSTAALVLVLVPLYQWVALALLLIVSGCAAAWIRWRGKAA